jgi:ribonuclease J
LRLIPLGGLGEVGMNCLALEQRGEALVVDCGVTFGDRGLGVDVIHPDFAALRDLHVAGLFVTHGHEDHIGAIPYFLRAFDVPVFGSRYALGLVRERAAEHEVLQHARLVEVAPRTTARVGSFDVEPVRVTHSIADATALAIRTDAGLVVHTGDFKFDEAPPDGEAFDVARFEELARERVRLLLSDSTNVVVALFASNVHRLRMLGEIARRHARKIVLLGRSVVTHSRVARATHGSTGERAGRPYLEWPSDLVWPVDRAKELPRRDLLVVATGSQGEPGAALARLARGEHPTLDVTPGDVVVMSSRVIPGNEGPALEVMAGLLRRGAIVRSWWSDRAIHVSGHAHREDQRRMIELVRPRAFIPVHGTLHHLSRHAALARDLGVAEVCVAENGDVVEVDDDGVRKSGRAPSGRVHVFAGRPIPPRVVGERTRLAAFGAAYVLVHLDAQGALAGDVVVTTQGVVDPDLDTSVLEATQREARSAVVELLERPGLVPGAPAATDAEIGEAARRAVRRSFDRRLGFRPVTAATVLRHRE